MTKALRDAGVAPDEIDYIVAHGTSTPLNDVDRDAGDQGGLRRRTPTRSPISSPKSMVGHLVGAAGIASRAGRASAPSATRSSRRRPTSTRPTRSATSTTCRSSRARRRSTRSRSTASASAARTRSRSSAHWSASPGSGMSGVALAGRPIHRSDDRQHGVVLHKAGQLFVVDGENFLLTAGQRSAGRRSLSDAGHRRGRTRTERDGRAT